MKIKRSFQHKKRISFFKSSKSEQLLQWIAKVYGLSLLFILFYLYNYMLFYNITHHQEVGSRLVLLGDPQMEGDHRIKTEGIYGWISVLMNDYYFYTILQNIHRFLKPSHILVLGDLFSYQYLSDEEYSQRISRYNWIFTHKNAGSDHVQLINITGNHDIGYASEVNSAMVQKFEEHFGPVNAKYYTQGHILGVVNSLNIDNARDTELSNATWQHLEALALERENTQMPLLLFTHIPLHKPEGNCVDPPYIKYTTSNYVSEQHMLSENATNHLLYFVKPKFVFNGHDHYGCIYKHNNFTTEYTIRSMMGDFGGYTGIFEISKAEDSYNYKFYSISYIYIYGITAVIGLVVVWLVILALLIVLLMFNKHSAS